VKFKKEGFPPLPTSATQKKLVKDTEEDKSDKKKNEKTHDQNTP